MAVVGGRGEGQRSTTLVRNLLAKIKAGAKCAALLVCTDGFAAYPKEIQRTFREPQQTGKGGRPHLIPWPKLVIGEVIKQYAKRRRVGVTQWIVQYTEARVKVMIAQM